MLTTMLRHLPCMKRTTLSPQRAICPARIANQIWIGSKVVTERMTKQMPSGMITCEIMEM